MESTIRRIKAESFIDQLTALACELGVKMYLTGGGLRDTLLGRQLKDLDFAVTALPEKLPVLFARRIGGTFFWLDTENRQSRVVKRTEAGLLTFDFAALRGADIEEDLSLRDFTINAMALELPDGKALIDPLQGEKDLRNKTIRRCSPASFADDPLRLLRAVRLAAQLGFRIEEETLREMTGKAPSLEKVAAERIRDELFKIMECPGLGTSLTLLHDVGLLTVVIPGGWQENVDHSGTATQIRAAARFEETVQELRVGQSHQFKRLILHLERGVEGDITALTLAKLAAFMRGPEGSLSAGDLSGWLRLGRKAARMLTFLCQDSEAFFAKISENPSPRAKFRFFRDYEPAAMELALLALAGGTISRSFWDGLADYYFSDYDPAAEELLLSGREVMELLGMGEGIAVGVAMEMLREAESRGVVESKEEARSYLQKNLLTKETPML